jgi:hypothetical protein
MSPNNNNLVKALSALNELRSIIGDQVKQSSSEKSKSTNDSSQPQNGGESVSGNPPSSSFLQEILTKIREYYECINNSILAGEYYFSPIGLNEKSNEAIIAEITEICKDLKKSQEKITEVLSTDPNASKASEQTVFAFKFILENIEIYKDFTKTLTTKIGVDSSSVVLSEASLSINTSIRSINDLYRELLDPEIDKTHVISATPRRLFFLINLKLALIDNNFKCTDEYIDELVMIHKVLKDQRCSGIPVSEILLEKTGFLLNKLITRHEKDSVDFILDGELKELGIKRREETKYLKEFNEISIKRYGETTYYKIHTSGFKERFYSLYNEIYSQNGNVFDINNKSAFEKIHDLSKCFFKIADTDQGKFENIDPIQESITLHDYFVKSLRTQFIADPHCQKFDEIAIQSLELLLVKNILRSIKARMDRGSMKEVKKYLAELKKHAKKIPTIPKKNGGIQHIDCKQYKVLHEASVLYLRKVLEAVESSDPDVSDFTIADMEGMIKDILDYSNFYQESFKWQYDKSYMPICMPFKDCIVDLSNKVWAPTSLLFLDSSYCLPMNFERLQSHFQKSIEEFSNIRVRLTLHLLNNVSREAVKSVHDSNEQNKKFLSDEMKNNITRNLEAVGFFIAIITFLLTGYNTFPKLSDTTDPCLIIFVITGITASILSFVLAVDYIIKLDKESRRQHKLFWLILALWGIFCICGYKLKIEQYDRAANSKNDWDCQRSKDSLLIDQLLQVKVRSLADSLKLKGKVSTAIDFSAKSFVAKSSDTLQKKEKRLKLKCFYVLEE